MTSAQRHAGRPASRSVEEIVRDASNFEFSIYRPFRQWLRAGRQLLTEANLCESDDDVQLAYLYLYRYAELVLEKLPQHPDYRRSEYKDELAQTRRVLAKSLPKLEKWKPRIAEEHQQHMETRALAAAQTRISQLDSPYDSLQYNGNGQPPNESHDVSSDSPSSSTFTVDPVRDQQLAMEVAFREIERRNASSSTARRNFARADDDPTRDIREAGQRLNRRLDSRDDRGPPSNLQQATKYSYPSIPTKPPRYDLHSSPPQQPRPAPPPPRPAKEAMYADDIYDRPARPAKEPIPDRMDSFSAAAPPIPSKQVTFAASPQPLSSQSALRYTFQSSARTESGTPLRSIFLPSSLRWTFLKVAQSNTTRNLETCGILCGTLISNALFITHLIIPDQTSTSDTCDTTESGDNALFDYCDSHQLIVCGWIHTHPTQTCFLSSRDLHTCSGYQVMLPEAIAIVCAPKHSPDWGIFRLTDPPGLRHVLDCRQTGLFHPHSETNLYTDALRPGHVVEGDGLEFELVDMRP
jgi:STAM-binding protein